MSAPDLPPLAFECRKHPATGSRGMVVTNHPLASGAATQILLDGGNAIDAAIAALFSLTVVEPMMVGLLGGGMAHVRLADGRHTVIDGLSTAPGAAHAAMFDAPYTDLPRYRETCGRANEFGALAVAVPGALAAWCALLHSHGSMPLADVLEPAVRLATRGFTVTPYLNTNVGNFADRLSTDPGLSKLFLPDGSPIQAGSRLVQHDYAHTLRTIAQEGAAALHDGPLGGHIVSELSRRGGILTLDDLSQYRVREREAIRGQYRNFEVIGPPPPASSGVHIVQMLNILEGFPIGRYGFGSAAATHLIAEALKIAFADRSFATADPDFVDVPVATLISRDYARERRGHIDSSRAQRWSPGLPRHESADTTHVTVADAHGNVVATTQTINGLFGACVQIEGTGMIANNYMYNFDPHPGQALSIAPGKRVFTSMSPMMLLRDGHPAFALGLPGGLRIFPSALQAIVNLVDHGMTLQQAVEAPRIWTEGDILELEPPLAQAIGDTLARMGHSVQTVPRIAGGMNAIAFSDSGLMTGAACWRADGTPIAVAGGLAQAGIGFSIA